MHVLQIPATPPFDFSAALRFLCRFPPAQGEQDIAGGSLTKALRVGGQTLLTRTRAAGDGVEVTLESDVPVTAEAAEAAADRLGFYLSLADDLTGFYAIADDDPPFAVVRHRLHGYHQVKFASPWENTAWAILAQRCPMPVAAQAKRRLIDLVGNTVQLRGQAWPAFPDADQVAGLDPALLHRAIGNDRKSGYLLGAARAWSQVDEQTLRHGDITSVRQWLLALPGIGPWSASFVLIRGLGRMEEITADREMLRAAARVYGRAVDEDALQQLAARYGSWRGYWAHYLRAGS